MYNGKVALENNLAVSLKKLNMQHNHKNTSVTFLGIYPQERKVYFHTKTCTQMFKAAFFITAPNWKQPKCPSMSQKLNKLCCIHTLEYYLATKKE